jgi:mono/diheme cytochrome c family protein
MPKNWKSRWFVAAAGIALAVAAVTLNAQGGGRGPGGGVAPVNNVPPPASPVTGSAVNGKQFYYVYGCYACHGYNGETGARPFVGRWGNLSTEQTFLTFLRGRVNVAPLTPSTSMPNFSQASLPDKQAKDIYAYIRTFKSSAPSDLKDAPALNAIVEAARRDKK